MAASTDLFMEVGDPGTATTLSAPGYTAGGNSMTVGSTSNWPTATGVIFAVDEAEIVDGEEVRIDGTYNEYAGKVASATGLTEVTWERGVGDRNYAAGALTRVYIVVSAERENRLAQGMVVQHKQDGTHANTITTDTINENTSANGITVDGLNIKDSKLNTNNSVVTANITDAAVTAAKIATVTKKISLSAATATYADEANTINRYYGFIPNDYVSGDVLLYGLVRSTASGGDIYMRVNGYRFRDGVAFSQLANNENADFTYGGTANVSTKRLVDTLTAANIQAGDGIWYTINRATGDSNTGIVDIDTVYIEYTGRI